MPRLRPPAHPVGLELDGEAIEADLGEPAAFALVAAGKLTLARSPKFHRPRGPACFRAACDGCLARVGGIPNVMTCRVPAENGMRIETQNVVGTRSTDLLRAADWLFPKGMNPHELFTSLPGSSRVLQQAARRIAGLGRLPDERGPTARPSRRREADVLVVGSGPGGMAAAVELSKRGRRVEVVDDDLQAGGSLRALDAQGRAPWQRLLDAFEAARTGSNAVQLRLRVTAAGIYEDDVLLAGPEGTEVVTCRSLVLAPGGHDAALAFEGNDIPGVMSVRAGGLLLAGGVTPGRRTLVVEALGEQAGAQPFVAAYARAQPGAILRKGALVRVAGSGRVRKATIQTGATLETLDCDVVLVAAPPAPAFELCAQAGARLEHLSRGYVVRAEPDGTIRPGVFALGEVVGASLDPEAIEEQAGKLP